MLNHVLARFFGGCLSFLCTLQTLTVVYLLCTALKTIEDDQGVVGVTMRYNLMTVTVVYLLCTALEAIEDD